MPSFSPVLKMLTTPLLQMHAAVVRLVRRLGGQVVKLVYMTDIKSFGARAKALTGQDVFSLVKLVE